MAKIEAVRPMSKIRVHAKCPKCANPIIQRSSSPQSGGISMNGATLWTFYENCLVCGWERTIKNVKIGA